MLNHSLARAALRTRLLTLSGTWDMASENSQFSPTLGRAYIEDEYTPGTHAQIGVGPLGTVRSYPVYHLKVNVPEAQGMMAIDAFRDALVALFYPRLSISLSNGTALMVRTDVALALGPIKRYKPGWLTSPVTISLWALTQNSN